MRKLLLNSLNLRIDQILLNQLLPSPTVLSVHQTLNVAALLFMVIGK